MNITRNSMYNYIFILKLLILNAIVCSLYLLFTFVQYEKSLTKHLLADNIIQCLRTKKHK